MKEKTPGWRRPGVRDGRGKTIRSKGEENYGNNSALLILFIVFEWSN